jgi:hypothetical protein
MAHENPDLRPQILPLLADEGGHVAAAPRRAPLPLRPFTPAGPPAKKPVNGMDIRRGFYECGDGLWKLKEAVNSDPNTKDDAVLVKAVADLDKAHDAVRAALKPYNWD